MAPRTKAGSACTASLSHARLTFLARAARCRVSASLAPLIDEHVVEKNVPSALINSGLERWLHARGIKRLVIVGVSISNSVEATARTAGNLGFDTWIVADATFTFAQQDYAGVYRTADEVHACRLQIWTGSMRRLLIVMKRCCL